MQTRRTKNVSLFSNGKVRFFQLFNFQHFFLSLCKELGHFEKNACIYLLLLIVHFTFQKKFLYTTGITKSQSISYAKHSTWSESKKATQGKAMPWCFIGLCHRMCDFDVRPNTLFLNCRHKNPFRTFWYTHNCQHMSICFQSYHKTHTNRYVCVFVFRYMCLITWGSIAPKDFFTHKIYMYILIAIDCKQYIFL